MHSHGNVPAGAEGDTTSITPRSETKGMRAVGMEHLDITPLTISHGHDPTGAEGDTTRAYKPTGARPT